jgi:hypothetical protein
MKFLIIAMAVTAFVAWLSVVVAFFGMLHHYWCWLRDRRNFKRSH